MLATKLRKKQPGLLEGNEYFVHIKQLLMESTIREYLKNLRHKSVVWEEILPSSSWRWSGSLPRNVVYTADLTKMKGGGGKDTCNCHSMSYGTKMKKKQSWRKESRRADMENNFFFHKMVKVNVIETWHTGFPHYLKVEDSYETILKRRSKILMKWPFCENKVFFRFLSIRENES